MKKAIILSLYLAIINVVTAQDLIYVNQYETSRHRPPQPAWPPKKSAREGESIRINHPEALIISAKVREITPSLVIYARESDPEQKTYSTPVVNIDSVVFASGRVQAFVRGKPVSEHIQRKRTAYSNLGTNIIAGSAGVFTHRVAAFMNPSDPDNEITPFVTAGFSYEKTFLKNRLGVEVAPFIAFNKKGYGGSVHTKLYNKSSGRFRVGMGPFYKLYIRDRTNSYHHTDGYRRIITRQVAMSVMGFGVQLRAHIDRNWLIMYNVNGGGVIGYSGKNKKYDGYSTWDGTGTGYGEMRLGLGYRF